MLLFLIATYLKSPISSVNGSASAVPGKRDKMQEKNLMDNFLRVIKYQDNIKGLSSFVNFEDKTRVMSEFFDNVITISTKAFKRKKREALDTITNDQDEFCEPETIKSDQKTATISEISGIKLSDFADMGSMPNVISKLQKMAVL